jgi:2,6-dihydroxypyridine 3-monooxygenase
MMSTAKAVVVGGSLGGLTAALWLRDAGCEVDVYERSSVPLTGQGAGIVLNPATVRYFTQKAVLDLDDLSVSSRWLRYIDRHGATADQRPVSYRFSSYNALYRSLLGCFGEDHYHLDKEVVAFDQAVEEVRVRLADGCGRRCHLLVCADGIRSTGRRLLLPDVAAEYAGYVAWRGTVGEDELSPGTVDVLQEAITYYVMPRSHLLVYPIPATDRSLDSEVRLFNWLWYRNVAAGSQLDDLMTDNDGLRREVSLYPGTVQGRHIEELHAAAAELPPLLAETVLGTTEPFVQVIFDIEVPRIAFGRVCLIGDAAFAVRPHTAAGTAKAAEDAWKLGEAIKGEGDVVTALRRWEPGQLRLGRTVLARTREAGRRVQFEGTWRIGDPLPFGLYEEGDSAMPEALPTTSENSSRLGA